MEMLRISIHARDDKGNELLRTCQLITDQTRLESGCKSCRVSQDSDNENIITLEQQWEQRPSLNNYFRSDLFIALLGAMKWLGRTYEVRINGGTPEEGRDAVKRARGIC
jgi:quinol monooxygenase YgiN